MERSLSFPILALSLGLLSVGIVALPDRAGRLTAADDARAVRTLQAVALEQFRLRASRVHDRDGDGAGEFGFLPDLWALPRTSLPEMSPAEGVSIYRYAGYLYRLWLPGPDGGPVGPDAAHTVDPVAAGRAFLALAWPERPGISGERAYSVTQEVLVRECTAPVADLLRRGAPAPPVPRLALTDRATGKSLLPAPPAATWPVLLPEAQRAWFQQRFREQGLPEPPALEAPERHRDTR